MGLHMSKGGDGLEGNFQVAFGKTKRKRYEKVANVPPSKTTTKVVPHITTDAPNNE